ncbi:nuclear transport factor 2 family protein [soil metagenome]
MTADTEMRALIDENLIQKALSRYWRGVDRLDVDLIISAFHPDAIDHHGAHDRPAYEFAHAAVERMPTVAPGGTQHRVGNVSIEVTGDLAWCEAYYHAIHNAGEQLNEMFGRYVHRFERREGEWKIAERWAVLDFTTSSPRVPLPQEANPGTPRGRADRTDISYKRW